MFVQKLKFLYESGSALSVGSRPFGVLEKSYNHKNLRLFKESIKLEFQQNEIVMLLLGVGVLIFTIRNRAGLKRLPAYGILMTAFYLLLVTWTATVLEGFIWNSFFNLLEHTTLAASSVLTAIWCWKAFADKKKTG